MQPAQQLQAAARQAEDPLVLIDQQDEHHCQPQLDQGAHHNQDHGHGAELSKNLRPHENAHRGQNQNGQGIAHQIQQQCHGACGYRHSVMQHHDGGGRLAAGGGGGNGGEEDVRGGPGQTAPQGDPAAQTAADKPQAQSFRHHIGQHGQHRAHQTGHGHHPQILQEFLHGEAPAEGDYGPD